MSTKHTPAPWWVTDSGIRDRGGYICHTTPATHYEGQETRFAEERAERAANKLLIAAAPDLLAALSRLFRNGQKQGWYDNYQFDMEMARAAIAAATEGAKQ